MGDERTELVIVMDPGPDPDDIKALLAAAAAHHAREVKLCAVVCNGGQQSCKRAALARCVLDHVDCFEVPVGVGSAGEDYCAESHEYQLQGFDEVDESRLLEGHGLLVRALENAQDADVTVLLISSLRDFADLAATHADLVVAKVRSVAIMGGLETDAASPFGLKPDAAVNNCFDQAGAARTYDFCFARGVPMTVVSRAAVPMIPMQCIRDITAGNCESPVLRYLAAAQEAGLLGLWRRLCEGALPARCTKRWFIDTFGGACASEGLNVDSLCAHTDIAPYLNGHVKPYDVVALMAALPRTSARVAARGRALTVLG